ncbi:hypothetical protein M9Y10_045443 [Tritrichomonas musculus]|uniref:Uncharacterized protein n=1 Tax=Tritrichomonas musculus TaxID=1915356 RepID=A0ABR2JV92_9EUKA
MKPNALLSTSPLISPQKTPRKSPRRSINDAKIPLSSPSSPTSNTLRPIHKEANIKQVDEFIPEPPLDTQFTNLGRTYGKIKDFFGADEKDNASTSSKSSFNDSNSFNSENLKDGSKENNQFDIEVGITSFSNSLNKLINDISQLYSTASTMRQNSKLIPNTNSQNYFETSTSQIDEQLKKIDTLFSFIYTLQFNVMKEAVQSIQKPKILLGPLFKKLNTSIGNCHKNYINTIWDLCKISLDNEDSDIYEQYFRPLFIGHLSSTIKSLQNLSIGIVKSVNDIVYDPQYNQNQTLNEENAKQKNTEHNDENADDGEELDDDDAKTIELQKNACNIYGSVINHYIVEDYSVISPVLKEYWTIDPKTKIAAEQSTESEENQDIPDEGAQLTSLIFNARCELLNEMYGMLDSLKPKQSYQDENPEEEQNEEEELEEEKEEELDEEQEAENYPLVHLLKGQLTKLSSSYLEEVKTLWLLSTTPKLNRVRSVSEFGTFLVNILKIRVFYKDLSLKLTTASSLFRISVHIGDDNTTTELIKILNRLFTDRLKYLTDIRMNEIQFISSDIPQFFSQLGDIDDKVGNELKQQFTQIYNTKSDKIKTISTQISDSLFVCQKTIFQYHRYLVSKQQKEKAKQEEQLIEEEEEVNDNEDEEMNERVTVFAKLDVSFNDKTHDHLENLKNYLNEIYANVLITTNNSAKENSTKANSEGASVSTVSAIMSASTASAKKARKNAKSKATRKKIEKQLNISERLQVLFTEESIARTYEEMFTSLQSLITVAIRNLDADMADNINKELRRMNTDHLNNLEEIRKLYVEALDIKGTRETEERMTNSQTVSNRIILKSLEESLKDVIEQTIDNYQSNLEQIEEEFKDKLDKSEKEFDKRFKMLEKSDIDDSITNEKKRKIRLTQEEQRQCSELNEREKLIKKLLNERRYEEAEREKRIYESEKVKERDARIKATNDKYKNIRKQKLNIHNRNIKILKDSHDAKIIKNAQEKQKNVDEQKKMLASSVRGIQQRILLFGTKLLQNFAEFGPFDQKVRKDLSVKFDKIVQNIMKEHGLSDVMQPRR